MKTNKTTFSGMILLALVMLCAAGCTKPNDNNDDNTDYKALIHHSEWDGVPPTHNNLVISFMFDYDQWGNGYEEGGMYFLYGDEGGAMLVAHGTYTILGNTITAKYTNVSLVEIVPWNYGHTYGLNPGQSKTVTYTIQSCTANTMTVKESVMGDTFTLTKYQQ